MDKDRQELAALMGMETDDLLADLGWQLEPQLMQFIIEIKPDDPETNKKRTQQARIWLAKQRARFRATICPNPTIKKLLSRGATEDNLVLVAAVADLIAGICINVAPATVAVLLVKQGLESLCEDRPKPKA